MRGVNNGILIGNATRDAELRHTSTGKPVLVPPPGYQLIGQGRRGDPVPHHRLLGPSGRDHRGIRQERRSPLRRRPAAVPQLSRRGRSGARGLRDRRRRRPVPQPAREWIAGGASGV